jgi:hypothetical protein
MKFFVIQMAKGLPVMSRRLPSTDKQIPSLGRGDVLKKY